jgi:ribose/xylose/arabinose/galactoside ABC-type transport system permease subunit
MTTRINARVGPARRAPALRSAGRLLLTERPLVLGAGILLVLAYFGQYRGYTDVGYLSEQLTLNVEIGLLALGQLIVIVSGRGAIDLSAGAIVSMCSMVLGITAGPWRWPFWVAVAAAVAAGWLLGALNGCLAAYVGYPAIIVTLATWYIWRSLALYVNNAKPISGELPPQVDWLADPLFGIRASLLVVYVPAVVACWVLLNRTLFGRRLYGVGTNDIAARFARLQVARTRFHAFALSGALAGVAAVTVTAYYHSARAGAGDPMVLRAITIAVLGGVLISGGSGRVSGVVLATVLVAFLNGGLTLLGVPAQYQLAALGGLLLLSALLNGWSARRSGSVGAGAAVRSPPRPNARASRGRP